MSNEVRAEAEQLWKEQVEPNNAIRAVVFTSGKEDDFIAGADINMIETAKNKSDLKDICTNDRETFDRVTKKGIPTIAAINRSCLGGDLERALHRDYRIASASKKLILGLPVVKLGFFLPGRGGTQLLRPVVGLRIPLDMALTGKNIRPDKALKMGLINETVVLHLWNEWLFKLQGRLLMEL